MKAPLLFPIFLVALLFLLLISPNTATFWNYRRRAVLSNRITADRELWLTRLILRTHPRSNETLFHRQWIVRNCYPEIGSLLDTEFELCDQLADLYRMQYGVWDYRRFLLRSTVGLQALATSQSFSSHMSSCGCVVAKRLHEVPA
ncbi:unnamed protein product [Dicrocoelium dendriticum]|nr:unnamed protein product [Dicrocoelium dendriticum]